MESSSNAARSIAARLCTRRPAPDNLNGCTFNDCSFHFEGAAALTVRFMTDLYPIAPQLIEGTFDKIRLGV